MTVPSGTGLLTQLGRPASRSARYAAASPRRSPRGQHRDCVLPSWGDAALRELGAATTVVIALAGLAVIGIPFLTG
jgi:hypothetical protein